MNVPKLRFHLLGLAHVPTHTDICSCAYTQKIVRLARMLKSYGHTVFFYGGEGSNVECDQSFTVISDKNRKICYGEYDWKKDFFKHDPKDYAHRTFNKNAIDAINGNKKAGDILLCPMGNYDKPICDEVQIPLTVESGIGYTGVFAQYKVWESYGWMNHVYGQMKQENGLWYDTVIPNCYDTKEFHNGPKLDYFLFIGRLISRKGLSVAAEVTAKLGKKLIVAGQGDLSKVDAFDLTKYSNVTHIGTVDPEMRANLMSNAIATFVPTWYIGPFEGVHVESMLCGTPVITTDWGVFPETNIHGVTGYRCRTFDEFLWAAKKVNELDSNVIQKYAQENFSIERGASLYNAYFQSLNDLNKKGWYEEHSEPLWDRYQPRIN
jgi:glycosyltransferase involved in cell wall biosynthesis